MNERRDKVTDARIYLGDKRPGLHPNARPFPNGQHIPLPAETLDQADGFGACGASTASETAATRGIAPAAAGTALHDLQFERGHARQYRSILDGLYEERDRSALRLRAAAREVARYHKPAPGQADRHAAIAEALADFLVILIENAPPGPERSTAISRAREAKMWASAAIALE